VTAVSFGGRFEVFSFRFFPSSPSRPSRAPKNFATGFCRAKAAKGAKEKEAEIFLRDLIAGASAVFRTIRAGSETGVPGGCAWSFFAGIYFEL
jgi:hypothetical protein